MLRLLEVNNDWSFSCSACQLELFLVFRGFPVHLFVSRFCSWPGLLSLDCRIHVQACVFRSLSLTLGLVYFKFPVNAYWVNQSVRHLRHLSAGVWRPCLEYRLHLWIRASAATPASRELIVEQLSALLWLCSYFLTNFDQRPQTPLFWSSVRIACFLCWWSFPAPWCSFRHV